MVSESCFSHTCCLLVFFVCLFSEIKPFPHLITFFGNKIVLLDMDQNQVVWVFSAEGDIHAMGYTADNAMGYYAQGDSLFLLNMRNRSSSEVCHYVVLLKGRMLTDMVLLRAFSVELQKEVEHLHITLPCS